LSKERGLGTLEKKGRKERERKRIRRAREESSTERKTRAFTGVKGS